MPTTIIIPDGFGYVGAALLSTVYLCAWQTTKVGQARKAAGIPYPQLYAEQAEQKANKSALIFNCTQRAHQNTLESLPLILTTTILSSLSNPVVAAGLCGTWVAGRVLYTIGYTSGEPSKRNTRGGFLGSLSLISLLGYSSYTVYKLVSATA